MIFPFFRILLIIFTIGQVLLAIFALIGSYSNKSYLNDAYLINYHLTSLNIGHLLKVGLENAKRFDDIVIDNDMIFASNQVEMIETLPTPTLVKKDTSATDIVISVALSVAQSLSTSDIDIQNGYFSTVEQVLTDIANQLDYRDLGFADVYSISFWGYCRGYTLNATTRTTSSQNQTWDNSNIDWTYCSPPVANYKFDPLRLFQAEITNMINQDVKGGLDVPQLPTEIVNDLKVLAENFNSDNIDLPGDLNTIINTLQKVNTAAFILLIIAIAFGFINFLIQILGSCMSPNNCCLSFLNILLQVLIFLFSLATAAMITALYITVRNSVNNEINVTGVRSFLSVNFYAYLWSSTAASLLVVIFTLLGHCVGLFGSGKKKYKTVESDYEK